MMPVNNNIVANQGHQQQQHNNNNNNNDRDRDDHNYIIVGLGESFHPICLLITISFVGFSLLTVYIKMDSMGMEMDPSVFSEQQAEILQLDCNLLMMPTSRRISTSEEEDFEVCSTRTILDSSRTTNRIQMEHYFNLEPKSMEYYSSFFANSNFLKHHEPKFVPAGNAPAHSEIRMNICKIKMVEKYHMENIGFVLATSSSGFDKKENEITLICRPIIGEKAENYQYGGNLSQLLDKYETGNYYLRMLIASEDPGCGNHICFYLRLKFSFDFLNGIVVLFKFIIVTLGIVGAIYVWYWNEILQVLYREQEEAALAELIMLNAFQNSRRAG